MTEDQGIYFTIICMAVIYAGIGYGMNRTNAKYLLAGYNTMSAEKKKRFDIDSYLDFLKPFFKKLVWFPLLSFIVLSMFFKGEIRIAIWSFLQIAPFAYFLKIIFKHFKHD